ncbi:MAG: hypothetical protein ACW975_10910 [Candidatus Thorarchaeota archaeon]
MGMIEIVVLLSIIVTAVFMTGIAAALGSDTKHSGRKEYYGPPRVEEEIQQPTLVGISREAH